MWFSSSFFKTKQNKTFKVIAQTEEIIRCRVQQRNITTVVEKLQLCLPGESSIAKYDGKLNKVSDNSQTEKTSFVNFCSCNFCSCFQFNKKINRFLKDVNVEVPCLLQYLTQQLWHCQKTVRPLNDANSVATYSFKWTNIFNRVKN